MKFTLRWLKDHLDTDASVGEIADRLNALGLEVEGIENPGEALAAFRVAEVLTAAPHPQADKLQVLTVDAGEGPMQVVCGAPNARAGMKGVFGPPGAYVPGAGITLKVAAIRGVESRGMMCSVRELELGDAHEGIIELPGDAPVGTAFPDHAGLSDPVIDVSVNPNRPDAMGVYGIARDLAASGLGRLKTIVEPSIEAEGEGPSVGTEDATGCAAFYAQAITGLTNGPSPDWLRQRLEAVGQKSISAVVDITNYVMLTYGRPLHAYERAKLQAGEKGLLTARRARAGEEVLALNGKTYRLDETMMVIADAAGVHDIAGIMGGEHSSVTLETRDVLLECAWFDPVTIARTGRALGLTSDARSRFERGVDPEFMKTGLAIATRLILDLCGGRASQPTYAGSPPDVRARVDYSPTLCARLAGYDIAEDRQAGILASLGFDVERGETWRVTAPSWRPDIEGAADIVEEVVRVEGLDKLPSTPLPRAGGVARPPS